MTREQLLKALVDADGAILYWQLPKEAVEAALADGFLIDDQDLLVHPDAIHICEGAYRMPEND